MDNSNTQTFSGDSDETVTPAGRLFLQPKMNAIIHCVIGGKHPINITAVKSVINDSFLLKLPRFTSILVTDKYGREHWRKTAVDLDRHVIVNRDEELVVNDYLADLSVSSPLETDKPLWEVHLLMAHKCAVFRLHHALGDGISLMSLLLSVCRDTGKSDPPENAAASGGDAVARGGKKRSGGIVGRVVVGVWWTVLFVVEFVMRALWKRDETTAVSGGDGVEMWPRKLVTARFRLDDMKTVKNSVGGATINDVLFGVISSGLSRYLANRSPKALREGVQLTGLAMVNLRPLAGLHDVAELMTSKSSGARWGNKFGMVLLPVYYRNDGSDPLQCLKKAKAMIDRKKQSFEAYFSYQIGYLVMSLLGAKFAGLLNYRICCNTTFTFSNVIGPKEEVTIAGNPVEYIRVTSTSLPHAIIMHMVSYAGRADMQILVAKDIIPDAQVLSKCFEDVLLEMKEAALAANGG